jgi:hypothetical protein
MGDFLTMGRDFDRLTAIPLFYRSSPNVFAKVLQDVFLVIYFFVADWCILWVLGNSAA